MTTIIDGKEISKKLREDLNKEIKDLKNKYNAVPGPVSYTHLRAHET